MRKFYYLPSLVGYVNINEVVLVDIAEHCIYLTNGKVIRSVPVDELNMIMELEQKEYYNEN